MWRKAFIRKVGFVFSAVVRLLSWSVFSAFFLILRYVLKTPQPLESVLSGESRLFRWTYGHVFYKVLGPHEAVPLVMLHTPEIGGSSYEWYKVIEQLAQH